MRTKTPFLLILSAALVAVACSSSPQAEHPDKSVAEETFMPASTLGIPAFAPLVFRDGPTKVEVLGGSEDVQAYRIGDLKVLHKRTTANAVVAAQLYIVGGSSNLNERTAGIEQLALNVSSSGGTESTPKDTYNEKLDSIGSSIGAFSDRDYSGYALQSVVAHFDTTWDLFVQTVFEPAMLQEDVELRRVRQLAEIKSLFESPDSQVSYTATRLLFKDHPYFQSQLGTADNVAAFSRDELRAYQRSLVAPERMLLVVVGNIESDDLIAKVQSSFGRLAPTGALPVQVPAIDVKGVHRQVETRALPTNYIIGLYPAPPIGHEDYAAMLVATRHLRDRLFEEVRTKRNLTYAVSAGLGNKRANYGLLYVTAVDPSATMPVIFAEVEKLKNESLTDNDLEEVRNVFLTSHYMNLQTNASQASLLAETHLVGGNWRLSETFLEQVRNVGPDDIQRVAKKYFQNYHFGIVGNPEAVPGELFGVKNE
ncbi:MAG: insulinase family protein [Bradymonadaceae bacterium]|nr:insulinase family protein [Lujinxingiaceae bacterium]